MDTRSALVSAALATLAALLLPLGPAAAASDRPSAPAPLRGAGAPSGPCGDARQVGTTQHALWHGEIIFSVKQFYSPTCHEVFGYAYPWRAFRQGRVPYDLGMAVFDVTHDAIDGPVTYVDGAGGPDFWSEPVHIAPGTCTEGVAHPFLPDTEMDTYTAPFCVPPADPGGPRR